MKMSPVLHIGHNCLNMTPGTSGVMRVPGVWGWCPIAWRFGCRGQVRRQLGQQRVQDSGHRRQAVLGQMLAAPAQRLDDRSQGEGFADLHASGEITRSAEASAWFMIACH